jgi:hypothetical protein
MEGGKEGGREQHDQGDKVSVTNVFRGCASVQGMRVTDALAQTPSARRTSA